MVSYLDKVAARKAAETPKISQKDDDAKTEAIKEATAAKRGRPKKNEDE